MKAVAPANGTTGVSRAADVVATFSEKMDPATLSKATFKLYKGKAEITNVTVTPSADRIKATLKPNALLGKTTTYQAVVTTGAKDLARNALDQNLKAKGNQQMTWSFKTGST